MQNLGKAALAELIGTYWLVLGGCGTAVLAGAKVGPLGVAIAFGLTIASIAYALGPISGGHFNPAVSLGLLVAGRFPINKFLPYVLAQVAGAILAAATLYFIASGKVGAELGGFAANGYGEHSPDGYRLASALAIEVVLTFAFLIVILGVTGAGAPRGFAPLAIGAALMLIHLISIPVTNTSVNPARSTGPALFADAWALEQLWLFWVAPLIGAALAGLLGRRFLEEH